MRAILSLAIAAALFSTAAKAQWRDYANGDWRFSINFPGEPEARDIHYISPGGTRLKGREFVLEREDARYSVKVIDFAPRPSDESRAIAQAASTLRWRGIVSYDAKDDIDGIPGHQLSLIERDGWRSRVGIYFFLHFLYIVDAAVAPGLPAPAQFQQSIEVLYPDGSIVDLAEEAAARVRAAARPKLSGRP